MAGGDPVMIAGPSCWLAAASRRIWIYSRRPPSVVALEYRLMGPFAIINAVDFIGLATNL